MIEVEKYNCNDRLEALKRERYWIENLKASLNKVIPSRTESEWYKENKSKIAERKNIYRQNNKEKISEQHKLYEKANVEKIKKRKEIYRQNNREAIREKSNILYNKNNTKIKCDICNIDIGKYQLNKHCKSQTHKSNLQK